MEATYLSGAATFKFILDYDAGLSVSKESLVPLLTRGRRILKSRIDPFAR
jgi:hypothetical protein